MILSTFSMSSSDALLPENLPKVSQAPDRVRIIEGENIIAYARALLTTVDDPNNHLTPIGDPYDGVARLILPNSDGNTYLCSGALLPTGQHVLTAAHCVTDEFGNDALLAGGTATFAGDLGPEIIGIIDFEVHPLYDGDFIKGNDIAILILENSASGDIVRYNYDMSGNAVHQVVTKVGYGVGGYFNLGWKVCNEHDPCQSGDTLVYPSEFKRNGLNEYDALADVMYQALGLNEDSDYVPGAIYQYDSDNSNSSNDAFGFFFGIPDSGQGIDEVMSAPGDSGGPSLMDTTNDGIPDTVVGITSYGTTLEYTRGPFPRTSDCTIEEGIGPGGDNPILDSSCGEFAGDTRVSSYSDFIVNVLTPDVDPPVITSISAVASSTTATITWTTDELATSRVDYGTDDNYGSSVSDAIYVTSHSIELTGLEPSTVYHFMVTSDDASNNSASSADNQFTTDPPPTLVSISISPVDPSITVSSTLQFTATGTYSDGPPQVLTEVNWSSSLDTVATIDGSGLADGSSVGTTIITATSGIIEGTTNLEVTAAPEDPTTASVSSIVYSTHGGRDGLKHLDIKITIINDLGELVSRASVSIDLSRDNIFVADGTGTTDTNGEVIFTLNNAACGTYETDVTGVIASGLSFVDDYVVA